MLLNNFHPSVLMPLTLTLWPLITERTQVGAYSEPPRQGFHMVRL